MRLDLFDLGPLFGQMHVDGALGDDLAKLRQRSGWHRPQRVRRNPYAEIPRPLRHEGRTFPVQSREAVQIASKSLLAALQIAPVTAALHVKHRQQGQADPGALCRRGDAGGHLG